MKITNALLTVFACAVLLTACIETEIVPEVLDPVLSLNPKSISLTVNQTAQIQAAFTDERGIDRTSELQWRSANPAVASIASGGIVSALSPGQSWIVVSAPGSVRDSTLVTVTNDPNQVAKVEIVAAQNTLVVGNTLQFAITVKNAANAVLNGKTVDWRSSNPSILSINGSGVATAVAPGSAQVTAVVEGVSSLPFAIEVTAPAGSAKRSGAFQGNSSYTVTGTAVLQEEGNALKVLFESNFRTNNGPGLNVYLAKNAPAVLTASNSVNLGRLKSTSGMQEYDVPAEVKISDFDFVVVYCVPFNIPFGFARLN